MDGKSALELLIRTSMGKQLRRSGDQELIATIGGTFDTLHIGHKEYIRLAFEFADRVLIYVNSDEYTNGKKHYSVQPYEYRVKRLTNYIREIGCENRYEIRHLCKLDELETDYLETDGLSEKIYMAIVSPEYYEFFLKINHARESRGMKSFLILVKLRKRDHEHRDISSSMMRHYSNEKYILHRPDDNLTTIINPQLESHTEESCQSVSN